MLNHRANKGNNFLHQENPQQNKLFFKHEEIYRTKSTKGLTQKICESCSVKNIIY